MTLCKSNHGCYFRYNNTRFQRPSYRPKRSPVRPNPYLQEEYYTSKFNSTFRQSNSVSHGTDRPLQASSSRPYCRPPRSSFRRQSNPRPVEQSTLIQKDIPSLLLDYQIRPFVQNLTEAQNLDAHSPLRSMPPNNKECCLCVKKFTRTDRRFIHMVETHGTVREQLESGELSLRRANDADWDRVSEIKKKLADEARIRRQNSQCNQKSRQHKLSDDDDLQRDLFLSSDDGVENEDPVPKKVKSVCTDPKNNRRSWKHNTADTRSRSSSTTTKSSCRDSSLDCEMPVIEMMDIEEPVSHSNLQVKSSKPRLSDKLPNDNKVSETNVNRSENQVDSEIELNKTITDLKKMLASKPELLRNAIAAVKSQFETDHGIKTTTNSPVDIVPELLHCKTVSGKENVMCNVNDVFSNNQMSNRKVKRDKISSLNTVIAGVLEKNSVEVQDSVKSSSIIDLGRFEIQSSVDSESNAMKGGLSNDREDTRSVLIGPEVQTDVTNRPNLSDDIECLRIEEEMTAATRAYQEIISTVIQPLDESPLIPNKIVSTKVLSENFVNKSSDDLLKQALIQSGIINEIDIGKNIIPTLGQNKPKILQLNPQTNHSIVSTENVRTPGNLSMSPATAKKRRGNRKPLSEINKPDIAPPSLFPSIPRKISTNISKEDREIRDRLNNTFRSKPQSEFCDDTSTLNTAMPGGRRNPIIPHTFQVIVDAHNLPKDNSPDLVFSNDIGNKNSSSSDSSLDDPVAIDERIPVISSLFTVMSSNDASDVQILSDNVYSIPSSLHDTSNICENLNSDPEIMPSSVSIVPSDQNISIPSISAENINLQAQFENIASSHSQKKEEINKRISFQEYKLRKNSLSDCAADEEHENYQLVLWLFSQAKPWNIEKLMPQAIRLFPHWKVQEILSKLFLIVRISKEAAVRLKLRSMGNKEIHIRAGFINEELISTLFQSSDWVESMISWKYSESKSAVCLSQLPRNSVEWAITKFFQCNNNKSPSETLFELKEKVPEINGKVLMELVYIMRPVLKQLADEFLLSSIPSPLAQCQNFLVLDLDFIRYMRGQSFNNNMAK